MALYAAYGSNLDLSDACTDKDGNLLSLETDIYPDYVRVCNSFGVKCERVMFKKDLRAAIPVIDSAAFDRLEAYRQSQRPRWRHSVAAPATGNFIAPTVIALDRIADLDAVRAA